MNMLLRERYLRKIRPYYDSELIKVITGVRRCGKSTILLQIMEEIKQRNPESKIVYYDFEDYDNVHYLDDPSSFYTDVISQMTTQLKTFLFIDEIQYLKDYENIIASIRGRCNCSVFVTGSNSRILNGELSTKLTGRVIEFGIMTFSYKEACDYTGREDDAFFDEYLHFGGFPLRFVEKINARKFSSDLYSAILNKDVFSRHTIEDKARFRNFASFVLLRSGEIVSAESISGYTKSKGEGISKSTCYAFLDYLEEAFLVNQCSRFDIKGKTALETKKKYYASDLSFIGVQQNSSSMNLGFILETAVYNELLSRGYNVSIGKTYKGEIDFVISCESGICYMQVCYLLHSREIIEREFGAYSCVRDSYPKYVVSMDTIDMSHNGIHHINIRDFMTGKVPLQFAK